MKSLVSIIIPVYNLEDYIENCLNSVLNQTYKNLEIICIDDGSTDASAEKINAKAEKDSRIKYVHQANAGVSAARNRGLDEATGDYIMFVDGDDYLHPQAVEILYDCSQKNNADMSCTHFMITTNLHIKSEKITKADCKKVDYPEMFVEKYGSMVGKSSCAKLIKADLAKTEHFPVGISNGEDGYYIILLLNHSLSVYVADCQLYYYYTRENSAVTSSFSFTSFSITYSFDDLCEKLKNSENGFLKKYCIQYLFQSIFYNRTCSIGTECEEKVKSESKRIGKKWLKPLLKNKDVKLLIKIMFVVFFYSRPIYELARGIQDPTMFDFYRSRRKGKRCNDS